MQMTQLDFENYADIYLKKLCLDINNRLPGSTGNRQANEFFRQTIETFSFAVESESFACLDWHASDIELTAGEEQFEANIGPYSLGCDIQAPLVTASSLEELKEIEVRGKVLLVKDELTKEQLMPKSFVFYNPDHHKEMVALLESKAPLALVAATGRDPGLAGGVYPFPLIEDGDFDIPNCCIKDIYGEQLASYAGQPVTLKMQAERIPSSAVSLTCTRGNRKGKRICLSAHIDAKDNTPGAIDNAGGTVVLLLAARLLKDYIGPHLLEILPFNGEDYYSAPGQMLFLKNNQGKFGDILLNINIDGVGYMKGKTHFALYQAPEEMVESIREVLQNYDGIEQGEPWYQGDHSLFIQQGVPAMSVTSYNFMELSTHITHTPQDNISIVDPARLAEAALAISDMVLALN
jgi:aminopeptidase YwaD